MAQSPKLDVLRCYRRYREQGYIDRLTQGPVSNDRGIVAMMTETEIQMVSYVEGILRTRGYGDLARGLAGVICTEVDRRARALAPPPPVEWSAAG